MMYPHDMQKSNVLYINEIWPVKSYYWKFRMHINFKDGRIMLYKFKNNNISIKKYLKFVDNFIIYGNEILCISSITLNYLSQFE